jgi:hypothetical protein
MSDERIFDAVFNLYGWLYQIDIPLPFRQAIEQQARSGWQNQDPSEQLFVGFLLESYRQISQSTDRDSFLVNFWEHSKDEFAAAERTSPDQLDDKGRLLVVIHWAIESIRPGSTGVASVSSAGVKRSAIQPHYTDDAEMQLRLVQARQKLKKLQEEALKTEVRKNMMRMYEMATKIIIN